MATPGLQPTNAPASSRKIGPILISLICLVVPIAGAVFLSPRLGWAVVVVSMIVYLLFLGRWVCGRPLGIFINERNLMSLSRFQMVTWSVLLLSAFLTVALKRLHVLPPNHEALPLNISMDWRLWALMGISATSLVGSPLILSSKATQPPDPKAIDKAAQALNEPSTDIQANSQGKLYSNASIKDASLTDMFQGDEVGNTAYLDVSKVQMFYFTVIAIIAYSYALYAGLGTSIPKKSFRFRCPRMLWLRY